MALTDMMSPPLSISAKVSPAQIEVLQGTLTGSHPAAQQPGQSDQHAYPKLHELRFTEGIAGVPVFGNLVNNLAGVKTVPANQDQVPSNDSNQQQSQTKNSKLSAEFFSGKMDQAMTAVKQIPSRMGSWTSFFDPKQFSVPTSTGNLTERLKGNLAGFYANYAVVSLILLAYCLLTSPLLLIGAIIYGLLAYNVVSRNQDIAIFGQTLSRNQQLLGLTLCSIPLFLLLGLTGIFFWLIGATTFLIALHSVFHDAPKPEDLAADAENGHIGGLHGDVHPDADQKNGTGPYQVISL